MRKRLIIYPLAAVMLLTLAACDVKKRDETQTNKEAMSNDTETPKKVHGDTEDDVIVETDWTYLTELDDQYKIYTRRYDGYVDDLKPAGDYGYLVPFAGAKLTAVDEGLKNIYGDGEHDYTRSCYGLVTTSGEIVVDPVYYSAYHSKFGPFLILSKVKDEKRYVTVAADDGSWCFSDYGICAGECEGAIVVANDQGLKSISKDGEILWDLDIKPPYENAYALESEGVGECYQYSGEILFRSDGSFDEDGNFHDNSYYFNMMTGERFEGWPDFNDDTRYDDRYPEDAENIEAKLTEALEDGYNLYSVIPYGKLVYVEDDYSSGIYDMATDKWVFRYSLTEDDI